MTISPTSEAKIQRGSTVYVHAVLLLGPEAKTITQYVHLSVDGTAESAMGQATAAALAAYPGMSVSGIAPAKFTVGTEADGG
jgi:hypothetical protein